MAVHKIILPVILIILIISCDNEHKRTSLQIDFIETNKEFNFLPFNNMSFELWKNKNSNMYNVFICREIQSCDDCRYRYLFKSENLKEYEIVNNTPCKPDFNTDIELIKQFIKLDIRKLKVEKGNVFVNTLTPEHYYLAKIKLDTYNNSNGKFEEKIYDNWYRRVNK